MKDKNKFIYKLLSIVFSVFILSWLANYLYESWGIYKAYDSIFKFIPNFLTASNDTAVRNVISGTYYPLGEIILIIVSSATIFLMAHSIYQSITDKRITNKTFHIVGSIFVIISSYTLFHTSMTKMALNYPVTIYGTRNLEIVKPYVEPHEYDLLKSDYYQIDSKLDFDVFVQKIDSIADKNNLSLISIKNKPQKPKQ